MHRSSKVNPEELKHGSRILCVGCRSFLGLKFEDSAAPSFQLLLFVAHEHGSEDPYKPLYVACI